MKLWSLTKEQIEKLTQQAANKSKEYHCLFAKASDDLWKEDLDRFEETYLKHVRISLYLNNSTHNLDQEEI